MTTRTTTAEGSPATPRCRVLFVAGSLSGGGAERRLVDLLNGLDSQRFATTLWLQYRRGPLLNAVHPTIPIEAFGDGQRPIDWRARVLAKLRCPSWARAVELRTVIQRLRPQVIVAWSLRCSYEVAWAVGSSQPWMACTAMEPDAEVDDAFGRDRWRHQRAAWTYRRAPLVMVNSVTARQRFAERYQLPEARLAPALHTRDLQRVDRLAKAEPPTWPGSGTRIVGIGRLSGEKGFDVLLRALAAGELKSENWQLVLLGTGPALESLQRLANELGLADRVWFPGFQENPYPWLKTADLFVLASRFEGLPNVLIEALVCQVPVIAADCPTGPREILEVGRWGTLVPVDDFESLAQAIREVVQKPLPIETRESARQAMLERYDLSTTVLRFEQLLLDLASSRPGKAS